MITRFTICKSRDTISSRFGVKVDGKYKPNYNAKQGDQLPIVISANEQELSYYQWGLVPYDSIDSHIGEKLINARLETIFAKKPFSRLVDEKRCIILADGFYLWEKKKNIPFRITVKDQSLFAIGGVWEKWENEYEDGTFFTSFSMITKEAPSSLAHLNDRVPAILNHEIEKKWFQKNFKTHIDLLFTNPDFVISRVTDKVNTPSNNHSSLIIPIQEIDKSGELRLF